MITYKLAKSKYRGALRAAVHHARKGNMVIAKHFFSKAKGIVSCFGIHNVYRPRLDMVGRIVGSY